MSDDVFSKSWSEDFEPKLIVRSNVTSTSLGPAFSGFRPVRETLYSYPYSQVKAFAVAGASILKRGVEEMESNKTPALIHSQWSRGYFHWITESLVRAIHVRDTRPDAIVVLPKNYNGFHSASLSAFGIEFEYFTHHNVRFDDALISTCPKHYGTTGAKILDGLRAEARRRLGKRLAGFERVYISRRKSRGRYIVNEDEVLDSLAGFGFVEIIAEDFSFEEQLEIFLNAKFIVSIHGAGLTNMVFMDPGSCVLELLPYRNGIFDLRPNTLSFKHDSCYLDLARKMGHEYSFLQSEHDGSKFGRSHLSNLVINCRKLVEKVESMVSRK